MSDDDILGEEIAPPAASAANPNPSTVSPTDRLKTGWRTIQATGPCPHGTSAASSDTGPDSTASMFPPRRKVREADSATAAADSRNDSANRLSSASRPLA